MLIAQIVAVVIFVLMFLMIVLDKFERHIITLTSGLLVLLVVFGVCLKSFDAIFETLNFGSIFKTSFWYASTEESTSGVNWATIIFIFGMMIMVESMGKAGFFRWLCLRLAKAVKYHVVPLLVCFMCMSGVLAMFIDSITVVLFLAAVTVELSRVLKFDPVPLIISEIFCANLGGAATMCGDPPNIIIGTSLGLSFADFLTNTGTIIALCFVVTVIYFFFCFKNDLKASEALRDKNAVYPQPADAIENKGAFAGAAIVFAVAVVLLVSHAQTGLTVAFIGVIVAILSTVVTLVTSGKEHVKYMYTHVDYKTLLFFIGLFISVGGLEQTGVLSVIADFIARVSGGNLTLIIAIILWGAAIASAFVDNIPLAATMIPVIKSMSSMLGIDVNILAWTLALGTDIGGNATPIGASANVVGTSVAAKSGYPISWGKYCRYAVPATLIVIVISMISLFVKYV